MTVSALLSLSDALSPNRFTQAQKLQWLSEAEHAVFFDVIATHEGGPEAFPGYDETTPGETVLLAPAPYDALYRWYLQAQMELCHGEMTRYNNSMTLFNHALLSFQNAYNRTHRPKTSVTRFRA